MLSDAEDDILNNLRHDFFKSLWSFYKLLKYSKSFISNFSLYIYIALLIPTFNTFNHLCKQIRQNIRDNLNTRKGEEKEERKKRERRRY